MRNLRQNITILLVGLMLCMGFAACVGRGPTADCGEDNGSAEVALHTSLGQIHIQLDGRTPRHRDNFLALVRGGHLDSLLFHRVIEGFMVQCGDPASRHAGRDVQLGEHDAGNMLRPEIVYPALHHQRGALAAARVGDNQNPMRLSSGSQFYIVWGRKADDAMLEKARKRVAAATQGRVSIPDSLCALYKQQGGTPHLDGQYTVFGRVTQGLEVVEAIQAVSTDSLDRPLDDIRVLRAEVVRAPAKQM